MQVLLLALLVLFPLTAQAESLGNLSANPFDSDSTANPFGAGSHFKPDGINNQFSPYGSPFSNQSATNPFATDAPRLYDQQGNYRGKLSTNPFDADSTSNPYGRYGNPYSPDTQQSVWGGESVSIRQSEQSLWARLAHRRAIDSVIFGKMLMATMCPLGIFPMKNSPTSAILRRPFLPCFEPV